MNSFCWNLIVFCSFFLEFVLLDIPRCQQFLVYPNFTILAGKLILLLLLTDLDLEVKTHQLLQSPLTLPGPFSLPVPTPPPCRPLLVLIDLP